MDVVMLLQGQYSRESHYIRQETPAESEKELFHSMTLTDYPQKKHYFKCVCVCVVVFPNVFFYIKIFSKCSFQILKI